jgi:transketolase
MPRASSHHSCLLLLVILFPVADKPSFIKVTTTIGFGSGKQGTEEVHGAPLGAKDLKHVKTAFGFDPEQSFVVPEDVSVPPWVKGSRD